MLSFSEDNVCILVGLCHAESDADSYFVGPGWVLLWDFLLSLVVSVLGLFSGAF